MTKAKTQDNDNNESATTAQAEVVAEPTTAVVIFAQDYRGVLTNEQYYLKGQAVEFSLEQAASLVEAGRATYKE